MRRVKSVPRHDYLRRIEDVCLRWHGDGGYWNESAYYEFTAKQVDELEAATLELHKICLEAVQKVIDKDMFSLFGIQDPRIKELISSAWDLEPPSVYGRFDLAYDGKRPPRMLEYNADTPTSLLEASIVQWYWLQDVFPAMDQFNSIHEKLAALWGSFKPYLLGEKMVHFTSIDDIEDGVTVTYLMDTAVQAGLSAEMLDIENIGWDPENAQYFGLADETMSNVFKLYPWEDLIVDSLDSIYASRTSVLWMEPIWKMLLSSKAIMPVLWEMFPGHPNLLESKFEPEINGSHVKKPIISREGQNVEIFLDNSNVPTVKTDGVYGEGDFIYQEYVSTEVPGEGVHAIIGSWMIGQESAGIGIRESESLVTDNRSRFMPHLFK